MNRITKRITALFLAVVMVMSMVGITPIFADGGNELLSASQIKNTYHDGDAVPANGGDSANVATASSDTNKNDDASVTVSKTISATGVENQFKIDLNVVTTEDLESVDISPDAAVVLVIDSSGSMTDGVNGDGTGTASTANQRMTLAKSAAKDFVTSFVDSATDGAARYVSVVDFDSDAKTVQNWVDVAGDTSYQYVQTKSVESNSNQSAYNSGNKDALDQAPACDADSANTYEYVYYTRERSWGGYYYYKHTVTYTKTAVDGVSAVNDAIDDMVAEGGTATAAGLYEAESLLQSSAIAGIDYVYVVLLTDGEPTYGEDGDDNGSGSVANVSDITDTEAGATACENQGAKVYTIAFAGENLSLSVYKDNSSRLTASAPYNAYPYKTVNDWLAQKVASNANYHSNATTDENLTLAFDSITESITKFIQSWKVTDPMGDYITLLSSETDMGDNNTNSVNVDAKGDFVWNLLNSTATQGGSGSNKTYTYAMDYLVELDTKASGFVDGTYYLTNGTTFLNYYFMETEGNVTTQSDVQTIKFNVPAVKGTAPTYTLTVNHYKAGTTDSIYTDAASGVYKYGAAYTTSDATIKHYTYVADSVVGTPSGTITADTTVTYYYAPVDYTLDVSHYDADGNVLIPGDWNYNETLTYRTVFSVKAAEIPGYTWNRTLERYGEMVTVDSNGNSQWSASISENTVAKYFYEKTPYTLTVNHLDATTNAPIVAAEVTQNQYWGDGYTTSNKTANDAGFTDYTYDSAQAPANANGTINGDTVVTYYYTKNDDTFTVNHYVAVVNGYYFDGTTLKTTEDVGYHLLETKGDYTGTIGTTVTGIAAKTYDKYEYVSSKTTLDGDLHASLTATYGEDEVMNLYYDFKSGADQVSYTENHYVAINANGYYYDDETTDTWVKTDATGNYKLHTETHTVKIGASVTVNNRGYANYTNPSAVTRVITEATDIDLYYDLDAETYSYTVEYYLEVSNTGWYYEPTAGTITMLQATDTVAYGSNNYVQYGATETVASMVYGTSVTVSTLEKTLSGYGHSATTLQDAIAGATFVVVDSNNTIKVYYAPSNSTKISYNVEYYLGDGASSYTQKGDTVLVTVEHGAAVELPTGYAEKFENYTYSTATFNDATFTTANATATSDTLKLYYNPSAMTYDVAYYLADAQGNYSATASGIVSAGNATYYGAVITAPSYSVANYTFDDATTADTMIITAEGQVYNLYFKPAGMTYDVAYYLADANSNYPEIASGTVSENNATVYGAVITTPSHSVANYTFDDATTADTMTISEDGQVYNLYYTPVGLTYNVAYHLYDINTQQYDAQPDDAQTGISTVYGATILASQYSTKGYDNYTFSNADTVDAITIENGGETLNLYYTPNTMIYNVVYWQYNEVSKAYEEATAYGAYNVNSFYNKSVDVADYQVVLDDYTLTAATFNDTKQATVTGDSVLGNTVTITANSQTINLYYNLSDTSATYNVNHYVEVVGGFYYDGTNWVASAEENHLILAETDLATNLGAVITANSQVEGFTNYSYVSSDASITVTEGGDNSLNLYYVASVSTTVDLDVSWVDEDGTNIATPLSRWFADGFGTYYNAKTNTVGVDTLEISQKTISGYTFKEMGNNTALEGNLLGETVIIYVYSTNSTGGNYRPPVTPSIPSTPDQPATDIPDTDVPLADIPEADVPLADIPDTDVPLTDIPEEDVPLVDIPAEDVPLSDIPQTGDDRNIGFMVATALVSAAGLAWLVKSELDEKKKHNN